MVQVVPKLSRRFNGAQLMAGGVALALAGMTWLSQLDPSTQYFPQIALPMMLLGTGIGTAIIPLTAASIEGVEPRDAGAASGLVNVAQQMGSAVGLAVMVTIFGAATRTTNHQQPQQVLAHGVSSALTGSAAFLLAALAVILVLIRRRPAEPVALPEAEPAMEYATIDAA
jgi:Na+/phosphate symporter